MAQQFNLTAQINLQSPKNVGRVVSDIQRQLKGSGLNTVNIKVKADPRSIAQTNRQLQNVGKSSRAAAKDINTLNRNLQEATRRFSVITLATGGLLSLVTGFKNSTKAAIEFERELVKISQVTGKTVQQLQGLTKEVTRLSTAFGVSSADLLNVSRTLAQAGFNAEKTRKALDILAKTTLAATFDNIQDTTEGAIALLRQFGDEAKRTGGDVAFLERSLDAINAVSKKFAVESGDLITVIRRVGGVFSAAGGEINELIALFTSVRATTRESAETIATGLRTIFTRIQRTETIDQLRNLNIELRDSQGNFVGAFEAVKRLSAGLATLDPRSGTFSNIVEELGGFRQIGKVIPLIQQFATAQDALRVAQAASGSTAKDAATAQQGLGVQIQKVREEFTALIRKFTDSGPFNTIATGALKIASAMIKVAEAVEPLLPLLTTMFGLKLGRALAPGVANLAGIARGGGGGGGGGRGFSRFARGGMVPGSGNRDTVPAMLTPGEFVIKKSSVKKLGSGTLSQMNKNGYATGGIVALKPYDDGPANPTSTTGKFTFGDVLSKTGLDINTAKSTILDAGKRGTITDPILKSFVKGAGKNAKLSPINKSVSVDVHGAAIGDATVGDRTEKLIRDDFRKSVNSNGGAIAGFFGASVKKKISDSDLNNLGITGVIGNAFEAILGSLGVPFDKESDVKESNESAFDFPRGVGSQIASKLKVKALASQPTDAKRTLTSKYLNEVYSKKYPNFIADEVKTLRKISIKDNIQKNEKRIQQAYLKSSSGVTQGDKDVGRILGISDGQVKKFRREGIITAPSTRNKGGGISGSDTVPAMLTPGEFVFNKSAAQSIGYGNLNRMNKQGVQGFADGGAVGFANGGQAFGQGVFPPGQDAASYGAFETKWDEINQQVEKAAKVTATNTAAKEKNTKTTSKNNTVRAEASKQMKSFSQRLVGVKTGLREFGGSLARGLSGLNGIAQSAQSFVFLAVTIGTVTSQLSGLSDTTKTAINRTATFFGTLIGLGATVVSTLSGVVTALIANRVATEAETLSKTKNAGLTYFMPGGPPTSGGGGKGAVGIGALLGKLAGPLAIVTGLFTAAAVAISFYNNKLIATTEKLGKAAGDLVARLKETGEGAAETFSAVLKAAQSADQRTFFGGAQSGAVAPDVLRDTELTGSRAARRAEIPLEILAINRSIEADSTAMSVPDDLTDRLNKIAALQQEKIDLILQELNVGLQEAINSFADLAKGSKDLSTAYSDLESRSKALSPEERRSELLGLADRRSNLINTARESAAAQLPLATERATSDEAIKASGGSAQVFFSSLEKAAAGDIVEGFDPRTAATLNLVFEQLSAAVKESEIAVRQSRSDVDEFAKTIDGSKTKAEIMSGEFGNVAKASRDSIIALGDAQAEELMARAKVAQEIGDDTTAAALRVQAREVRFAANERAAREREYHENIAQAAIDRHEAEMASIAATQAIVAEQKRILELVSSIDKDIVETNRQTKAIENLTSVRAGGSVQASATALTNTDLSSIVTADQRNQLEAEMDQMIANADPARRPDLRRSADRINAVTEGVGELNQGTDAGGLIGNRRGITEAEIRSRLEGSLGDIPKDVLDQILADLSIEKVGDEISPQELANALSKYTDLTNEQVSIFEKLTTLEQSKLEKNRAFLNQQEQAYNQELKSRQSIAASLEQTANITLRSNKILAQSRGDQTQIRKNIGAAEGRRIDLAQGNLDAAGVTANAGDIGGLSAEARRLQDRQARIAEKITRDNLSEDKKIKLENESVENARQLKAVNAELGRLATQTGRVDDLFGEMQANLELIEKERKKREQVLGVVEEFVVGGQDTRKALVDSANGIRLAFATGTLQNQTEQQRTATIGLLDKLSDVPLLNGFTGGQIKQELIFRDAIKLGLDPKIAQALATATTKEQQLIDSNERLAFQLFLLTQEMTQARVAQGALGLGGFANGGMVQYRAGGGSIFKPRGTDTVPAMLTPGEFVIQKSAVDRIGADNLAAMNGGGTAYHRRGGIVSYFNGGGKVEDMKSFIDKYINDMKKISVDQSALGVARGGTFTAADYNPLLNRMRIGPRADNQTIEHESLHFISSLISELSDRHGEIPAGSGLYKYIQQKLLDKRGFDIEEDSIKFMAKDAPSRMDRFLGKDFKGVPGKKGVLGFPSSTATKEVLKASGAFREEYAVARALGSTEGYDPELVHTGSSLNTLSKLDNFMISAGMKGLTHQPSNDVKMFIYKKLQETLGELNPYAITEGGGVGININAPLRNSQIFKKKPKFKLAEPKSTPAAEKAAESEAKNKAKKEAIKPTPVKPTPAPVDDPFGILSPQSPGVDEAAQAERNKRAKLQIGPDGEVSSVTDRDRAAMSPKDSKPTPYDKRDRASTRRDDDEYYRRRQKGQGGDVPKSSVPTPYDKRDRASTRRDEDAYYKRREKGFTSIPEPTKPASIDPVKKKPRTYTFGKHLRGKEFDAYREFIIGGGDYRSAEAKRLLQKGKDAIAGKEQAKAEKQQQEEAKKQQQAKDAMEKFKKIATSTAQGLEPFSVGATTQEEANAYSELIKLQKELGIEGYGDVGLGMKGYDDPVWFVYPEGMSEQDKERYEAARKKYRDAKKRAKGAKDMASGAKAKADAAKSAAVEEAARKAAQQETGADDPLPPIELDKPESRPDTPSAAKNRQRKQTTDRKERANYLRQRAAQLMRYGPMGGVVVDEAAKFGVNAPRHRGFQPLFGKNMSRSQALAIASQEYDSGNLAYGTGRSTGPRSTTGPGRGMSGPPAPNTVRIKATYDRLLRTQGPMVAQQYAQRFGYTPPGGFGGGRGITRPFRQRSGGGMGTMNFQQFMMQQRMFNRMQQFRGGVMAHSQYRATGGGISGADTVPAMLTPGEFVMSAGAVRQHGVGTMRALNRGQISGFNRGGVVGGVQYRNNGGGVESGSGGIGINTAQLEQTLNNFVGDFSERLDSITGKFINTMTDLSSKLGYFDMNHNFVVSGTLNIAGVNIDTTAIALEFTNQFTDMVKQEVKSALNNPELKPGQ